MKRYIVASRSSSQSHVAAASFLRAFGAAVACPPGTMGGVASVPSETPLPQDAKEVKTTTQGTKVVQMTAATATTLAANPDLVVEEDTPLKLFGPGIPGIPAVAPAQRPFDYPIRVTDAATGAPVPGITVFGMGESITYKSEGRTDAKGNVLLSAAEPSLRMVLASPADTYWSKVTANVNSADLSTASPLGFTLTKLPAGNPVGWGHAAMGFPLAQQFTRGRGVRVGIIDSGIFKHADLKPSGGFNTLDGEDANAWDNDLEGHGTHCAGIVAAQGAAGQILGAAPDAEVFSIRVFPGGFTSDLVEAIEWCIENRMDVISMSLGMSESKEALALRLADATNRGIVCLAATGNDRSTVAFPAAFPSVIAVGAIGQLGTFPQDSGHALKIGQPFAAQGTLFPANFTNFGPQVQVCAPGVAVISTVPSGFAAFDGTSMACPMVSGATALLLSACPKLRFGTAQQTEVVRFLLGSASVNLGLPPIVQGRGMPWVPSAIAMGQQFFG